MKPSLSQKCSEFVQKTCWEDIPEEVHDKSKYYFLDWMGALIAGSITPEAGMIIEFIDDQGGKPQSNVVGLLKKTSCIQAALGNGYISHVLEVDDVHSQSISHPASPIDAAALSVAQYLNKDGKSFLLSTILGYEIMLRIGEAVTPSHYNFWHTTATCGTFGSAIASGKLLNLSVEQLTHAMGNAGTQAAGLWEFLTNGAMSKYLHTGKAAMNGVISSLLAKKGYTGAWYILEGERGLFKAYSNEKNYQDYFKKFAEPYKIIETSIKNYASCTHTHTAIDSILKIKDTFKIDPNNIKEINIYTYQDAKRIAGNMNPKSSIEAKFSIPYCVAAALLYNQVGLDEFLEDKISNPQISELILKTNILIDEECNRLRPSRWPSRVEVVTYDDNKIKEGSDYPKGSPENPLSQKELENRFIQFSNRAFSEDKSRKLMEIILNLENLNDIDQLFSI